MSLLAPTLQAFFTDRLIGQKRASPHTIAAYRDTIRLLLSFAAQQTGKAAERSGYRRPRGAADRSVPRSPRARARQHASAPATRAWQRSARCSNTPRSDTPSTPPRSNASWRSPPNATTRRWSRSSPIPSSRRCSTRPTRAPGSGAATTRMILLAAQTGLRASELIGLTCADLRLGTGAHVNCLGKGRKQRITPLTKQTVTVMQRLGPRTRRPALTIRCSPPAPAVR